MTGQHLLAETLSGEAGTGCVHPEVVLKVPLRKTHSL